MKVVVGISGGVDSSVALYLLKDMGYEVEAVYFDFLTDDTSDDLPEDVSYLSKFFEIKVHKLNYRDEFRKKVVDEFISSYKNGMTPNPCAICNGSMKFEKLLQAKKDFSADKIATGHYANVKKIEKNGDARFCIAKSKNANKDQSYMLYTLSQAQLENLIFPISDLAKEEVRKIASDIGLNLATKKDSQDICFIDSIYDNDYKEFIISEDFGTDYREKIARGELRQSDIERMPYLKRGEFVDMAGNVIATHRGIINYTIGQRKGLNVAFGERKFVVDINAKTNQIILGSNEDLYSDTFEVRDIVYQGYKLDEGEEVTFTAKLRYRHIGTKCLIKRVNDILYCKLQEKVRAITRGQAAVFYNDNDEIMFGGIIVK